MFTSWQEMSPKYKSELLLEIQHNTIWMIRVRTAIPKHLQYLSGARRNHVSQFYLYRSEEMMNCGSHNHGRKRHKGRKHVQYMHFSISTPLRPPMQQRVMNQTGSHTGARRLIMGNLGSGKATDSATQGTGKDDSFAFGLVTCGFSEEVGLKSDISYDIKSSVSSSEEAGLTGWPGIVGFTEESWWISKPDDVETGLVSSR